MGRFSRLGTQLYDGRKSIDFVGRKWLWYAISGVIVAVSLSGLLVKGLNLGIEFKGGVEYTVSVPSGQATQANADKIRKAVSGTGIAEAASPTVVTAPKSILVTTETMSNDKANSIATTIAKTMNLTPEQISSEEVDL